MKTLIPVVTLLSLAGCGLDMLSLHPLYESDQDLVLEPAIHGAWLHHDGEDLQRWTIRALDDKLYELTIEELNRQTRQWK